MRRSMEKEEKALQELNTLVKKRKWKNRLSVVLVVVIVIAIAVVSLGSYIRTRQTDSQENMDAMGFAQNMNGNIPKESGMVMANGTTSVGIKAVTFEIDFLEDTSLYVEKVHLANGDSVEAGDKYIKFTEESITDARKELESTALSAQLAYRSGQILDGESRLQAKYTYDTAILESQFAKQVYDNTIAQLEADYAQSIKTYEKAQQEYQEYLERVQNNSFYDDYDIANLKKAYEEAKELYTERKEYWEVTDDELKNSSSETVATAGIMTLSGSVGDGTVPNEGADEETSPQKDTKEEVESKVESGEEQTLPKEEPDKEISIPNANTEFADLSSIGRQENQDSQNERKWIIKTINLLEQEVEEAEEKYTTARKEYEAEIASAELTLQKLLNKVETAREDYTDAQISYQKQSLNAENCL